ncbi:unnamed protein product [Paramecium pentaurelia]|uniref:Uncharacterized protein n=1 Tax=Paramecium pentaurelia TaxID=43138 RepID=A0A8S1TXN6_9CILI|nr:unnamed protein product [Paramecium pentaurelia]
MFIFKTKVGRLCHKLPLLKEMKLDNWLFYLKQEYDQKYYLKKQLVCVQLVSIQMYQ